MDVQQSVPQVPSTQPPVNRRQRIVSIIFFIGLIILFALLGRWYLSTQQNNANPSVAPTPGAPVSNLVPEEQPKKLIADGTILVRFTPGVSDQAITTQLAPYGASIQSKLTQINTTVVKVPVGQEEAVLQKLKEAQLVQAAEPNYIQQIQVVPNDPNFSQQWGLVNTGQNIKDIPGKINADIQIEDVWSVTDGEGVRVAVLDTGIDLSHPDLATKVVGQKIIATDSINDAFGHGTHVAGILAAQTDNNQGIAGACPSCELLIVKVMRDDGTGDVANIASGIIWAADNGAKVINISAGGYQQSQIQQDAINYAWNKGVVIVAAAGNDNKDTAFYPAAYPNVIAVGATTNTDTKASFSNYGGWVKVAAPGQHIYSTLPTKAYRMQLANPLNLTYDFLSGTSMAAPLVSGIIALQLSTPQGAFPATVVNRLYASADKIEGTGNYWANGRVNAMTTFGITPPPVVSPSPTPTQVAPTVSLTPTQVLSTLTPIPTNAVPTSTLSPTALPSPTLFVPSPTRIPTHSPFVYSPTIVAAPTMYCLGSCPTIPLPVTPTLLPTQPEPTVTEEEPSEPLTPSEQPTPIISEIPLPDGDISPTPDPCIDGKQPSEERKGFFRRIMEFFLRLIQMLFGMPQDRDADPACPTPTPTIELIPSMTATPSAEVSPTATISATETP